MHIRQEIDSPPIHPPMLRFCWLWLVILFYPIHPIKNRSIKQISFRQKLMPPFSLPFEEHQRERGEKAERKNWLRKHSSVSYLLSRLLVRLFFATCFLLFYEKLSWFLPICSHSSCYNTSMQHYSRPSIRPRLCSFIAVSLHCCSFLFSRRMFTHPLPSCIHLSSHLFSMREEVIWLHAVFLVAS